MSAFRPTLWPRVCLLVLALIAGLGNSNAREKVWVGLYFGQNSPPSLNAVSAPPPLVASLHEVFGFNFYSLVKADEIELNHEWEHWVIPRNDFFIRVMPLHHEEGAPRLLDYELYRDGFIIAKGTYEPSEGTPLFITGPNYRQGRLIFVLMAK